MLILLTALAGWSQSNYYPKRLWKTLDVSGELKLRGQYRQEKIIQKDFTDIMKSPYYMAGISLYTKNYILNPNFLTIDIAGKYFPQSETDSYIVTPDRSEILTLKGFSVDASLFQNKLISVSGIYGYNQTYRNREYLTNIRADGSNLGATILFNSKKLPVTISFNEIKLNQKEIETGYKYFDDQKNFKAGLVKSFGENDYSELAFTSGYYKRIEFSSFEIENQINNISFTNYVFFDKNKKYKLLSNIFNDNQSGNNDFNIFNVTENLTFVLPLGFGFRSDYNYNNRIWTAQESMLNRLYNELNHQLFESLNSSAAYEYAKTNHTNYTEIRKAGTLRLNYRKRILSGKLNVNYQFQHLNNKMNSVQTEVPIINEELSLVDNSISLLTKPYVLTETIVVKDRTGTNIYRPEIDYFIITQGDFTEIQRIPGGQIENGETVFIDYVALQSGSYSYDAFSNRLFAGILLFNEILNVYSNLNFQNYTNVIYTDFLTLNYIKQYTIGGKINLKIIEGGIEYDSYNSTITPYTMMHYFVNVQKNIKDKITISANGNLMDYYMIDEKLNRIYSDVTGNLSYYLSANSSINLQLLYRKQVGEDIDLDLYTGLTEFKTLFRKFEITAGIEFYKRNYLNEIRNFKGVYLQLLRKF